MTEIPYGRPVLDDADVAAVSKVLGGHWLTQGPYLADFEDRLRQRVGAEYAVAFSSGTAALHAAAAAAGIGSGDTVVTTPLTFVASANCGRYLGADVRLVDVDPATLNLDTTRLPANSDAVVLVHYAGLPADTPAVRRRARVVIEDAAHALGAVTPDGPVGNCAHSDMCVFSFHPVKAITTAEGGAVTTNDRTLADALRRFRSHGMEAKPEHGGWYYEVTSVGFNYRLSDVHAALGASQLDKLDDFVARRNELAMRYREELPTSVQPPPAAPKETVHAYHLFAVQVPRRRTVYDALRERGILAQVHYVPLYHHPIYRSLGDASDFPATEHAYSRLLSLPLHAALTDDELQRVVAAIREVV